LEERLVTQTRDFLRKYSDLPALLYLLETKSITFLDPAQWDDKNDSFFMQLYKEHRKLKSLLAICFSGEAETYHHWSVFAHGSSGVCISFKKKLLLGTFEDYADVRVGEVSYLPLNSLKTHECDVKDLPFMKRAPYAPEGEFRAIYEDCDDNLPYLNIKIALSCVDRITLSPWMPKNVADSVKKTIQRIPGADKIEVTRSTLVQNDTWAKFGRAVVGEKQAKRLQLSPSKRKG
jgi:hypothetical protein